MKYLHFMLWSSLLLASPSFGGSLGDRFHGGFSAGFGLPQMPPSQFRSPISILGGGTVRFQIHEKYALKSHATALTSFSLGTMNGRKGMFTFDLQFLSLALARKWKGEYGSTVYYFLGLGEYHFHQQINEAKETGYTAGLNLGLEYLKRHALGDTFFELGWHLLFHPASNPQILTLSFGLLL